MATRKAAAKKKAPAKKAPARKKATAKKKAAPVKKAAPALKAKMTKSQIVGSIAESTGLPILAMWHTLGIMVLVRTLSWLVGYPTRYASPTPPHREMCAWQSEIPDV